MDNNNIEIKEIVCKYCGHNQSEVRRSGDDFEWGVCLNCHKNTYYDKKEVNHSIKCPYCQSSNVKKISNASKVAGIATFGIFALGKATKEWHCNNCKSNF